MSGGRGRGTGRERGADLRYNMEISLQEAFAGKTRKSAFRPRSPAKPAPAPAPRPAPSRRPVDLRRPGPGPPRPRIFTLSEPARTAMAAASRSTVPCGSCAGSGRVTRERTLAVNIPAGVEDGTRIRLSGEGEAGVRGGPPGDLYIFLSIGLPPVLSARGRRSALPGPGFHGNGGDGRRVRGADHRWRQDQGEGAGRDPVRPPFPSPGQRYAGTARAAERRHVRPGRGQTPQKLTKSSASCWPNSTGCRRSRRSRNRPDSSARSKSSSTAWAAAPASNVPHRMAFAIELF